MNIFEGSSDPQGESVDPPRGNPERITEVEGVLDQIRPNLQSDGGDVRLIAVDDDGVIEVTLLGACSGCQMKTMTLREAMEPFLKQHISWMTGMRAS
jgi:Fe-S cluster biogenesis protein NfuA